MQDLNVSLVQTYQYWKDKKKNLLHFTNLINDVDPRADLILLPEMFNTGFNTATYLAEGMNGECVSWMLNLASIKNKYLAATLMIKENGHYFNRFVVAGPNGLEKHYDKVHLFSHAKENEFFTAGKKRVVIKINGWNLLLQTCYDLRFPVFSRNQEGENRFHAMIYLANWPEKRVEAWSSLLKARAIENQCYVVGVNRVGPDGNGIEYSGQSAVYNSYGGTVLNCHDSEKSYLANLNASHLKSTLMNFNTLRDA